MTHTGRTVRWVSFVALTTSIVGLYCMLAGRALPPLRNEPASLLLLPMTAIAGVIASLFCPLLLRRRSRASRGLWMYVGFVVSLVFYGLYLWRVIPDGTAGLIVAALVFGHLLGLPALLAVILASSVMDRVLFRAGVGF